MPGVPPILDTALVTALIPTEPELIFVFAWFVVTACVSSEEICAWFATSVTFGRPGVTLTLNLIRLNWPMSMGPAL